MKIKLAALVGALALAGVAAAVVLARRSPHKPIEMSPAAKRHHEALAYTTAPLDALYQAPAGKTPCESAYNAYKAEMDTSKQHGVRSHFTKLADRPTFLARCEALPKAAQPCMIPRYRADHDQECGKLKPSDDALKGMFEVRQDDDDDEGGHKNMSKMR